MTQSSSSQSELRKIIVDINLYLSYFVFRSTMLHHIIDRIVDDTLALYTSQTQLTELQEKFVSYDVKQGVQEKALFFLRTKAMLIHPTVSLTHARDKKDNFLLELAETAQADYLITRDNDLLVEHHLSKTRILSPEEFLPLMRSMGIY
jgi:putative PIN family toxin of toxin-antitoxin system